MEQGRKKQGFIKRLFGKKQSEEKQPQSPKTAYDYSVLPEMAAILTNGNERAVSEMRLLAGDIFTFVNAHRDWCVEMDYADFGVNPDSRQEESLLLFGYWLTGYMATGDKSKDPAQFGAYIDWKEETDDIIWNLGCADNNLGYGLGLDQIKFDYTEFTDKALQIIGDFMSQKGHGLVTLDTQSDCYHLFVLRGEDFERLTKLAEKVGFRFFRKFI